MGSNFFQRKIFKAGLPFIIFVVGASFAMTIVTDIRYTLLNRKNNAMLTPEQKRQMLFEYARNPEGSKPLKELINSKTLENWKADPQVKTSLEELINQPVDKRTYDPNDPELKKKLAKMKEISRKRYTIEEAYLQMREQDLSDWENKRIPRPYEEKNEE